MEYCPDCIEKLVKQSKKLGQFSCWLVCPKCGYRTREKSVYEEDRELERFKEYKNSVRESNKFKEK